MDNLNLSILKENFKKTLQKTNKKNFLLAVSGGVDSMLLLKIATLIKNDESYNFRAIHINHNYSSNAKEMEKHCSDMCHEYSINLTIKNINLLLQKNIEEQFRNKRYKIFFNDIQAK